MTQQELIENLRGGSTFSILQYLSTQPINSVWEGKARARHKHFFLTGQKVPIAITEYLPDGTDAELHPVPYVTGKSYLIEVRTRSIEKGNVSMTGTPNPSPVELTSNNNVASAPSGGSKKAA